MLKTKRKVRYLMEIMIYKYKENKTHTHTHTRKKKKNQPRKRKVNFVLFRFSFKFNKKHDQNASSHESYRLLNPVAIHMLFLILFTSYICLDAVGKNLSYKGMCVDY